MDPNVTDFNNVIIKVIEKVNAAVNNSAKDSFEEYYKSTANGRPYSRIIGYILAALIILCNLSVVVSSGLILKKGQRPKSTYLLLGNVSLADTILGISIVYGLASNITPNDYTVCTIKMGLMVCAAMVSIFSVGFIAVDRYIFIVHGLYYERWFNTRRVRIGILIIWLGGIVLGFLPSTGWVNKELPLTRCFYLGLFPKPLLLLNSALSLIPIAVVAVLYTFILITAIKNVKRKQAMRNPKTKMTSQTSIPTTSRQYSISKIQTKQLDTNPEQKIYKIKRSVSLDATETGFKPDLKYRSKSNEDLTNAINLNEIRRDFDKTRIQYESDFSVCTVETTDSIHNQVERIDRTINPPNQKPMAKTAKTRKTGEISKWRAVKVVMLSSGSIIITWIPFFVTVILFEFCEDKLNNPKCVPYRALVGSPLAILALSNSLINPIIYAWWHKGFKRSIKGFYRQYFRKCNCLRKMS